MCQFSSRDNRQNPTLKVSLVLIILLCAATPLVAPPGNATWEKLQQRLGTYSQADVVLFGDSIMAQINTAREFGMLPFRNRAVAGRQATMAFSQFTAALTPQTRNVVVLLGTNDLGHGTPLPNIVASLAQLGAYAEQHQHGPVFCSVLPATIGLNSTRTPVVVQSLNAMMQDMCARYGYGFINIYPQFLDHSGGLREDLTYDGLHLNRKGRAILASAIKAYFSPLRQHPYSTSPAHASP